VSGFPLPPGSAIGILGGGQLGRMLSLAAAKLGFDVVILCPEADSPAARVSRRQVAGSYDDPLALAQFSEGLSAVTFEFENVPSGALERLAAHGVAIAPGPRALAVAQDRVDEKTFLNAHGVATVAFEAVDSGQDCIDAVARLGAPCLLKTRREGYDGKGQAWIERGDDPAAVFDRLGGVACILEAPADFVRELSVIAARGRDGEIALYPLGENHHEGGVLRRTLAPAQVSDAVAAHAEKIAHQVLNGLDYVGVMGIELFELSTGVLLVNEIAPRVHNTGHWTQDGCEVDQFEQHIRAVAGWPLGPTNARCHVEMTNLLGDEAEAWAALSAEAEGRLHLYGKIGGSPGRKMGHINRLRGL
jgi:5-(carboxyamino)imidazole ribonucleotide synthase